MAKKLAKRLMCEVLLKNYFSYKDFFAYYIDSHLPILIYINFRESY